MRSELEEAMRQRYEADGAMAALLTFAHVVDGRLKAIEDRLGELAAQLRRYGPVPP